MALKSLNSKNTSSVPNRSSPSTHSHKAHQPACTTLCVLSQHILPFTIIHMQQLCSLLKWMPREPCGFWSNIVFYIRNWVPFGMCNQCVHFLCVHFLCDWGPLNVMLKCIFLLFKSRSLYFVILFFTVWTQCFFRKELWFKAISWKSYFVQQLFSRKQEQIQPLNSTSA